MNPNLIRALLLVSASGIFHPAAYAFEESPAVPERLLPGAAARQRALPEHFSAVAKSGWEDRLPQVPELTGELIEASRAGQAGVNIDEEASRLMQYQQHYQAAARMMQVASRIFDDILTLGR